MSIFSRFYTHLYANVPNPATSYVGWGDIRPDGDNPMVYLTVEELLGGAVEVDPTKRNMYFSVAPLAQRRNKKENVIGSSVAWVDYDGYKDKSGDPVLTPPQSLVPYSFAVASGGPGGYHLYWLLNQWVTPDEIEALNKVLLRHLGNNERTDRCWNANRVLRVPGTLNFKSERGPLPSKLVIERPDYRYDYADLMKLGQVDPDVFEIPTDKDGNPLSRSERDWRLVMTVKKWGVSDNLARLVLMHHSDKAQAEPGHYVERTLSQVSEAVEAQVATASVSSDDKPVTNCEMVAVAQLKSPQGDRLGLMIRVDWKDGSKIAPATGADFSSRSSISKWLRAIDGGLTWWGSDAKVALLYSLLVDAAPETTNLAVEQAGRYDLTDGTRVFIYGQDKVLCHPPRDEMVNVAWTPKISGIGGLDLGESSDGISQADAKRLYETLLTIQPAPVLFPALGWTMATLFKPVFETLDARVPLLMLYGVRGSGKTSLIQQAIQRMVGLFNNPISADITPFALTANLSTTNAWPVWIGEFRANNRNVEQLQMNLRAGYDGGTVERGTADMSVNQYQLTAPVILDGETALTDSATVDRAISLKLDHKVVLETQYVDAFERLRTWEKDDWKQLAKRLIVWTLTKDREYVREHYEEAVSRFEGLGFTSRVINNIAVVWAGWSMLADYMAEYDIPLDLSIDPFVEALNNTHKSGMGNFTQADQYIAEVSHFAAIDPTKMGVDYDGSVMWVSLTRAKLVTRTTLSLSMLETQLEARIGTYVVGKERRPQGSMWGIDLAEAAEMGLDVAQAPQYSYKVSQTGEVEIKLG